jgi:hypothetical protein
MSGPNPVNEPRIILPLPNGQPLPRPVDLNPPVPPRDPVEPAHLREKIFNIAIRTLKFLGGVIAAGLTPLFALSTVAATGATMGMLTSPAALITGAGAVASAYCTYKCAKLSFELFKSAFA